MSQPISVAQLNRYVATLLEQDGNLNPVLVRGEISGFKAYSSGHLYFTLKDDEAAVGCVMFKGHAVRLRFRPTDGLKVVVTAKASIYDRDGRFQLYVQSMTADGVGDLYLAFEQLKSKLEAEGLFDPDHKKQPPLLPRLIGVVTSPSGAVIRDILQVLTRRFPNFRLQLIPVAVQGEGAAAAIAAAIDRFNALGQADVLIVGRGGGSMEDLWAFNEEVVARAVYRSKIPVISAVGHETDFTICDFVADVRASTPSVAAELAVPVKSEQENLILQAQIRLRQALSRRLERQRLRLDHLLASRILRRPLEITDRRRLDVDRLVQRLVTVMQTQVRQAERRFSILSGKLDALSPLKVLARGYGVVTRTADNSVLLSTALVKPGENIEVWLRDGIINCDVRQVRDWRQ
ncbi:MAG: exodeoxyribonuclease VII large subunit [Clostridiaceae bacterium]|jgi:exodeoxyribonuclease VII large subunit|nr:exodeoxyribonuclease VII large subunit [Clostridiaceae bacterium]